MISYRSLLYNTTVLYDKKNPKASKAIVVVVPVEWDSPEDSKSDVELNMELIRLKNSNILSDLRKSKAY